MSKPLNTYLCSYFLPKQLTCQYFKCQAEDTAHAEEQLLNAEPCAELIFCEIYSWSSSHV